METFETLAFEPVCQKFTLESFVCKDYGCDACHLLVGRLLSVLQRSLVVTRELGEGKNPFCCKERII